MYNQPYFIPGYFQMASPMMRGVGTMGRTLGGSLGNAMNGARVMAQGAGRGLGLFSKLGSGMQAIKGINWGSLITNTSKTLNVVNQAIPLVRQVGPMFNNMKSIMRIASIFKDETDSNVKLTNKKSVKNTYKDSSINNNSNSNYQFSDDYSDISINDNSPTFFVNS